MPYPSSFYRSDMAQAVDEMTFLESMTRREYQGCRVCKHNATFLLSGERQEYCQLQREPIEGLKYCKKWGES